MRYLGVLRMLRPKTNLDIAFFQDLSKSYLWGIASTSNYVNKGIGQLIHAIAWASICLKEIGPKKIYWLNQPKKQKKERRTRIYLVLDIIFPNISNSR